MKNDIIQPTSFSHWLQRTVIVKNGSTNGRSVRQPLLNGRITISGIEEEGGQPFKRIVHLADGQILDNTLLVSGKTVHRIAYGRFESKVTPAGREITRFRKGTGKGKHGKSVLFSSLFGKPGVCHSWYKNGRINRQRFFYDNGILAYDWRSNRPVVIKGYDGDELFTVKGDVRNPEQNWQGTKALFWQRDDVSRWFREFSAFKVSRNGRVIHSGQYDNRQRTGIWTINGIEHCYERGVAIPRKLYETPPEKLNPVKLLKISNAQVRMAMLAKVGPARLTECGKIIHREGTMRLFDIPGMDVRILRVQCPSTQSFYHLKVPKDSINCEEARQWTFHVNGPAGIRLAPGIKQISFAQET